MTCYQNICTPGPDVKFLREVAVITTGGGGGGGSISVSFFKQVIGRENVMNYFELKAPKFVFNSNL